jgi:hypothetical protein
LPEKYVVIKGTITKAEPMSFWVKGGVNQEILFILQKDSQIYYSDREDAKPSDLKVGRKVRVHTTKEELARKKEPPTGGAYIVIIEKE